jgi:hypothetical protein
MASNSSGVFAVFVANRSSCHEIKFLKIIAGFRYMGVTMTNQNNLHEEFHSLVTNEEYMASDGSGFDN